MKKVLVVGVILLFLGVGVAPTIGISNNDDTTPPVTTIILNPEFPTGLNDWYVTPVTVTLVATDDMSGVKEIHYRVNDSEWNVHYGSFLTFVMERFIKYNLILYLGESDSDER